MAGSLHRKLWTALIAGTAVICFTMALPAHPLNAIRPGPSVDSEDPLYLYNSMLASVAKYQLAAQAAQSGKFSRQQVLDHICYDDLGCFFLNGTFGNFWTLPFGPELINTTFHLYTSAEQTEYETLSYTNINSLTESGFRGDLPTTILIHGFGNKPTDSWMEPFRRTIFHNVPQGNFIVVDWQIGAMPPSYWSAAANTQVVGAQIARLIAALNTHKASNSSSFHLIGYSLGAHVAGYTGARLVEYGHEKAGRITALDPAGPIFEGGHPDALVSPGDADFVTGFHGNGASLLQGGFGLFQRVGDIDFYPNGGQYQPGCPQGVLGALSSLISLDFANLPTSISCNHNRALALAIEVLDPTCLHHSYACENYTSFKEGTCDPEPDGQMSVFHSHTPSPLPHYLVTKDVTGYCANALKVTVQLSASSQATSGSISVNFVGKNGIVESVERVSQDEDLPSGKTVVEVLPSRFEADEIEQVKVVFKPRCLWFWCSPDRLTIETVVVENLSNRSNKICGGFHTLIKDQVVPVALASC